MKRGIFLAPFDELADPQLLAELARDAERAGFDGFFLWDHVDYRPPVEAILDPWICMAAIAVATERVRHRPADHAAGAPARSTSSRARPRRSTC